MNWAQFKDSVSHVCLAGAVEASWSLTQEVPGSNPFTVMTNIFVTEFAEFSENILEKLHCSYCLSVNGKRSSSIHAKITILICLRK